MSNAPESFFDPSHPDIQQKILENVSTMAGMIDERRKAVVRQEIGKYIESKSRALYEAYAQLPAVVGAPELHQLQMYSTILMTQVSTVGGAISMMQAQIEISPAATLTCESFSTLLAEPYMPTALQQYFSPVSANASSS
jgi:hypothetical protein